MDSHVEEYEARAVGRPAGNRWRRELAPGRQRVACESSGQGEAALERASAAARHMTERETRDRHARGSP